MLKGKIEKPSSTKTLCQTLDQNNNKEINVLFTLEKETCMNWIIAIHFLQALQKKYSNVEFDFGVSEKFLYFKHFCSNIKLLESLKKNSYNIKFRLPTNDIFESLKNNEGTFNIFPNLNNKYIGLNRFMVTAPKFQIEGLNGEYSDKVFFNLEEDDPTYKKISKEIKKCSFQIVEFKNLEEIKQIINKEEDSEKDISLIPGNGSFTEISSNGFINYNSKFLISGNNKVEGKIIPSESIVLRYKNDDPDKYLVENKDVHKLSGSGMVEYDYVVELGSNSIIIKLDLNELKIQTGFTKNELLNSKKFENKKDITNRNSKNKELFIQELKECKYYIGKEDANFLIASMILGPNNCILLDKETKFNLAEIFSYFDISNIIDIEKYENGIIESKLEELHLKG